MPGGRDEFHRLRTAYLRLRSALRDPTTNLYTFTLYFDEIRAMLTGGRRAGTLWVGLGDRRLVETVYGWEAYDHLIQEAAAYLGGLRGGRLPEESVVAVAGVRGDAFTIFVPSGEGGEELNAAALAGLASALREGLEERLAAATPGLPAVSSSVRVGAALLEDNPFHRFERRVYQAIDEARALADRPRESERLAWLAEMQRLLREKDISAVFQPIVDLETRVVMGLEAYARGPVGTVFAMPRVMFSVGRDAGLMGELDRLCRHRALESLKGAPPPSLLFLNVAAENLVDPDWRSPEILQAFADAGLGPREIVLDVPESEISGDPLVYKAAVEALRSVGYRLSLDDMGSSARTVALVEELRPEFLKFDLTLVRGVGSDPMRRELVRSLVELAEKAGARLVAERVESEQERQVLLECGAGWGQGYLFGAENAPESLGSMARRTQS